MLLGAFVVCAGELAGVGDWAASLTAATTARMRHRGRRILFKFPS
jgi:hypothetical protein